MLHSCVISHRTPLAGFCALLLALCVSPGPAASSERELELREGDILTHSAAAIAAASALSPRSIAVPSSQGLWSDGIVPYRIDSGLSTQSVRAINEAIEHWNDISAITLQPAEVTDSDLLLFQPGSGCASWVGRQGGVQEVWAAPTCTVGSMMHEIGHALGLEHEHTRPDRDQYITIHWDNIDPLKHHNFDVAPNGSRMVGDYDYASIMHYGSTNFSLDGSPTITPTVADAGTIGQRRSPSAGDIAAIARLYRSDLSLVSNMVTSGLGTEVNLHISSTQEQGAHGIEVVVRATDHTLLDYSGTGWSCKSSDDELARCSLDRLSGSTQSILRLNVSGTLTEQSMHAELSSKTPDNNLSNNGSGVDFIPSLAAATVEDDPIVTTGYGGGVSAPVSMFTLLLLLFYRQAGSRIDRKACHRIKRLPLW